MENVQFGLSKSKITAFQQCVRKLWLSKHKPEEERLDDGAEGRFAAGHEVGDLACSLLPEGVMVHAVPDLQAAVRQTREILDGGGKAPIFEATFEHDGILVRVDVLTPQGEGWSMAEVKSTASVKDYHLGDLATQVWVATNAGLSVTSASIRHINTDFRLEREGDYTGFFRDKDLLGSLGQQLAERPTIVADARAILAGEEPIVGTGDHCSAPFPCGFVDYCRRSEPEGPEWPISLLPNTGKAVAATWAKQGVGDLRDVPIGQLKGARHERIRAATASGEPYHDRAGTLAAVEAWLAPRAYLDFETISPAIPRWVGTRPFQQIPFQYSCHIETGAGDVRHSSFLAIDGKDPRGPLAESLIRDLEGSGSIVAYNAAFERRCVRELAEAFPNLSAPLSDIEGRIVDLLPVTKDHYYHRDQRGSWSIKAVLPTIAPELAYDDLVVKDGGAAQTAWFEAVHPDTSEQRREEIRTQLELYCERDTEAMVILLKRLIGA